MLTWMLMSLKSKSPWSLIALLAVVIAATTIDLDLQNWKEQRRVVEHDVHSYYAYLPAFFIYDDLTLEKGDYKSIGEDGVDYYKFWPLYTPEGRKVIKMSMGLSFLYAPFFFAGHAIALSTDAFPANGFSEPYKILLLVSALFYLMLGLFILLKLLFALGFNDGTTAITLLLVGAGTNLLAYASQSAPNVHVYNFFLFTLFIWLTMKWYKQVNFRNSLAVGLVCGLIVLVRPSNAIVVLLFMLYGIERWSDIPARLRLWLRNWPLILLIAALCIAVWIPQLLYWKSATGHWIYYSYNDEGFFFDRPRIIKGLFSWRKGWLLYTPIMAFALVGIAFMRGLSRSWQCATIVFTVVNVYIIFSWWCWWYGGTYGQRTMVDSYALMAIPLAAFVQFIRQRHLVIKLIALSVAGFFIWLNVFQTYQFEYFSLHYDGMSKELYFRQFGKMDKIENFDHYVDWPDYDKAKEGKSEKR